MGVAGTSTFAQRDPTAHQRTTTPAQPGYIDGWPVKRRIPVSHARARVSGDALEHKVLASAPVS
jgi:hypothetical protein